MLISRMCTPLPVTLGLLLVGCGESPEIAVNPEQPALASEAGPPKTTSLTDIFPVGLGRQVVLDACGVCHAVACSAIGQRTRARWENLKNSHRDHVADMSEDDFDAAFAYLSENFNDAKPEPTVPPHFLEGGCTPF